MSGMYPDGQTIEIFGGEARRPGADPETGRFTNGSFSSPDVKPSFIPARTINLILDCLTELIGKCSEAPNPAAAGQLAALITPLAAAHKIIQRDAHGRAKAAAPAGKDGTARLEEAPESAERITPAGFGLYRPGVILWRCRGYPPSLTRWRRRVRCNGTGTSDFTGLPIGDYPDGIDLPAAPAGNGGTGGQPRNEIRKNSRITPAAFNPYKGVGDNETVQNHIRFDFANVPLRKRMNPANDNAGGYRASEARVFLEGANGDGTGSLTGVTAAAFLNTLKAQLGGDYVLPARRLLSVKGDWAWMTCSLRPPSEDGVFGESAWGESAVGDGQKLHIPLYRDPYQQRFCPQ